MGVCQLASKVPIPQHFGCRLLLRSLLLLPQDCLGPWHQRTEKRTKERISTFTLSIRSYLSCSLSQDQQASFGVHFVPKCPHIAIHQTVLSSSSGILEGIIGKLTANLTVLCILVFFLNLPVIYSLESSNSCSVHFFQVLRIQWKK